MAIKKTDAITPAGDIDALREQVAALSAQNDKMLDHLVEQQDELERLKAAQPVGDPVVDDSARMQADLDAELEALKREFADFPAIQMFERRAVAGRDASHKLRLVDEPGVMEDPTGTDRKWKLRFFDFGTEGRAFEATAEGYVKVKWTELRDAESLPVSDRKDEYVRKGDRGLEVLCKTPLKMFTYKRRRDALRQQGLLTSESKLKAHLANGSAAAAGKIEGMNADQVGSFIDKNTFMTIKKGETERVSAETL